MSTTVLLAVLSLVEMLIVAVFFIVLTTRRNRNLRQQIQSEKNANAKLKRQPSDATQPNTEPGELNIGDHLQTLIDATQLRAQQSDDHLADLLNKRVSLLETEKQLLDFDPAENNYWNALAIGLNACFPPTEDDAELQDDTDNEQDSDTQQLAELDELDITENLEEKDTSIDAADLPPNKTDAELDRLKSIVNRQFSTIDELKNDLLSADSKLAESAEIAKKLEQITVAQAQLNLCIETLEQENDRLKKDLHEKKQNTFNKIVNNEADDSNEEIQAELTIANQRIENLERESSHLTQQVKELEYEIITLNEQLEEKNRLLKRYESDSVDLSKADDEIANIDPDKLKQDIEQLTEMLMTKSQLLSELQAAGPISEDANRSTPPQTAEDDYDDIPELTDTVTTKQHQQEVDDTEQDVQDEDLQNEDLQVENIQDIEPSNETDDATLDNEQDAVLIDDSAYDNIFDEPDEADNINDSIDNEPSTLSGDDDTQKKSSIG